MYTPHSIKPQPAYVTRVQELLNENYVYMDELFGVVLIGSGGSFMERVNGVAGHYQSLSGPGTVETARRMIVVGLPDIQQRINRDERLQADLKPGGLRLEDVEYSVSFSEQSDIYFAFTVGDKIVYTRRIGTRKPLEKVYEEPFSTAVQIIEQENKQMHHG
jgi:hypothetical protein